MRRKSATTQDNKNSILYKQTEVISVTSARFSQFKLSEVVVCLMSLCGFGLAAIVSDLDFIEGEPLQIQILSSLCTISTCILIFTIYWRTKQELQWEQAKGIYTYLDSMFSTKKLWVFMFEALLNSVHPIVGSSANSFESHSSTFEDPIQYNYSSILTVFMLVRFYHVIRLISILSDYRSNRNQRLCQMNGSYAGTVYAIKCMMQDSPFIVMTFMFLTGIFIFGYALRQFERPAEMLSGKDFSDYGNALWCVITTMTTVGYGDYYPVTFPGRIIGFCACFWGVLVISFMTVSLYNFLVLDTGENNSLLTLQRLWFKEELKKAAAFFITSAYRYRYMIKNCRKNTRMLELQLGKMHRYKSEFERCKNKMRTLYNFGGYNEIIEYKLFDILDLGIDEKFYEKINQAVEKL